MSGCNVEDEYRYMLEMSWDHPEIQVNHMIATERKVNNRDVPKTHTKANCDYHHKRYGHCLYCDKGIPVREKARTK